MTAVTVPGELMPLDALLEQSADKKTTQVDTDPPYSFIGGRRLRRRPRPDDAQVRLPDSCNQECPVVSSTSYQPVKGIIRPLDKAELRLQVKTVGNDTYRYLGDGANQLAAAVPSSPAEIELVPAPGISGTGYPPPSSPKQPGSSRRIWSAAGRDLLVPSYAGAHVEPRRNPAGQDR